MVEALDRTLPSLAFALVAFYSLLVMYWAAALRPSYPALAWVWAFNAVAFAALGALAPKGRLRTTVPSIVLAGLTTMAGGSLLHATGNPALAIALCVTLLGLSLVIISPWILLSAGVLSTLAVASATFSWPAVDWSAAVFAVVAASIVALIAQSMRIRVHDRLEESGRREREAEARVQAEKRRREEAEAMSRFLRLAAHQLGNPLTAVTIQARRLTAAPFADAAWQRSAHLLDRNVQRLAHVVGDILLVSQHQGGVLLLQKTRLDLATLVHEAVQSAAPQASAAGVQVVERPGTAWAMADAAKLHVAIEKLVENAVRHSPPGQAVEVMATSQGAEAVVLVEDRGEGVPEARRVSLFGPLASDVMRAEGGGLGLPVCKAVVEAHGGRVTYEPRPGGGSRFAIRLPAAGLA